MGSIPSVRDKDENIKFNSNDKFKRNEFIKPNNEINKTAGTNFNQSGKSDVYRITNNFSNTLGQYDTINMLETKTNFEFEKTRNKKDGKITTQTDSFNKKTAIETNEQDSKNDTKNSFGFFTKMNFR